MYAHLCIYHPEIFVAGQLLSNELKLQIYVNRSGGFELVLLVSLFSFRLNPVGGVGGIGSWITWK